jgi:hypothetical protein
MRQKAKRSTPINIYRGHHQISVVWNVEDMGEKAPSGQRWRISIETAD